MSGFDNATIAWALIRAVPWTLALSLIAFVGGATVAAVLTIVSSIGGRGADRAVSVLVGTIQSVPLLMVIFLCFFGLPLLGIDVSAWTASSIAIIAFTGAFLADIWRAAVRAVPKGQWEAAKASGMSLMAALRHIVLAQAARIAIPPTVGFATQVVKATALASIVGFVEVTRAGYMLNNITYRPFFVFCLVGLIYIAINLPLSLAAKRLERRLAYH